jgi:hypothetical protein
MPLFLLSGTSASEIATSPSQIVERYVDALGGRPALERLTTRLATGRLVTDLSWTDPQVTIVPFEICAKIPDRILVTMQEKDGIQREGFDGTSGWRSTPKGTVADDAVGRSHLAFLLNPQNAPRLTQYFPKLVRQDTERRDSTELWVLEPEGLDPAHWALRVDAATGRLVQVGHYLTLEDYREVDGVLFPFRIAGSRKGGSSTYEFDAIRHNAEVPDSVFIRPAH